MPRLILILAALCLAPSLVLAQSSAPPESRLQKVQATRTIALAYRTDALPFSFEDDDRKPAGYTVDLCRAVVAGIERQLGVGPLRYARWFAGLGDPSPALQVMYGLGSLPE